MPANLSDSTDYPSDKLIPESLSFNGFGLPSVRHIPGSGTQPDAEFLAKFTAQCTDVVDADNWKNNLTYRYGWFLFINQYYWETHEVWEAVWIRCRPNSRERYLLQALIQAANARLKVEQNNFQAAEKILLQGTAIATEVFVRDKNHGSLMGVCSSTLFTALSI
jgi:hypothetical protein